MAEIVRKPKVPHECHLGSPHFPLGTKAKCDCGRRWKVVKMGFTYKGWRRTFFSWLFRGRAYENSATAMLNDNKGTTRMKWRTDA